MGTTGTLDTYESDDGTTSWLLYEELFESGAVYLELNGVNFELEVTGQAQTRLVLRLPLDMARRLATAKVTPAQWARSRKIAPSESGASTVNDLQDPRTDFR
ncbi:hypothetical protein [Paraburkholderia sediminicola]|uniref:hypothetical protein n=1 Tax=Paraburkholderia sediminicola TaxID=458836 RepID=UPI0038B6F550